MRVRIAATVTGRTKDEIIHVPAPDQPALAPGESLRISIDWPRRYLLMRMHTACHLLTVVLPYPITGAAVSPDDSRVDFDIRMQTSAGGDQKLMELVRPIIRFSATPDQRR